MHEIYLGYSKTLNASEILEYFDLVPNFDGSDFQPGTQFRRDFGLPYIDKGDYEVYDQEDLGENDVFGPVFFNEIAPFSPEHKFLSQIDFTSAKSIFFVETSTPKIMSNDKVTLIGPIFLEKYDFE